MKREIIKRMIEIAIFDRASDLSYDLKALEGYEGAFLWITYGKSYTRLVKCSEEYIIDSLNNSQSSKYYYARNGWKLDVPDWGDPKFYWYDGLTDDGLVESNLLEVSNFTRWIYERAVKKWKDQGNEFPTQLTIGSINFLCDDKYVREQLKYAEKHNDNSLKDIFERFKKRPRCNDLHEIVISKDFSERSFIFTELIGGERSLTGGIIFHGYPNEGYKENNSVQLTPTFGWQVHT